MTLNNYQGFIFHYEAYWPMAEPSIKYFPEQGALGKIRGSSQVVYQKLWALWNDICRWCRVWARVSWCQLVSVRAWVSASCSHRECSAGEGGPQGIRLSTLWLRSKRSAKWGLENNTAWYNPVKKNLWVNIAEWLCLPPSLCLSRTIQGFDSRRKNKKTFISFLPSIEIFPSLWVNYN